MAIYFTLQEALSSARASSRDYNPVIAGGPKPESIFSQKPAEKSEIKPVVKGKTELGDFPPPPPTSEDDPNKAVQEELERKIRAAQQKLANLNINEPAPIKEVYKEPPSLIKGLAVDLIDPAFTKSQIIKGASKVEQVYSKQNEIKPIAKLISKTKSKALKVAEQALLNVPVNLLRHPIIQLQKSFLRDPIENRDMLFSIAVNEIVQKAIFPNNPELALTLPEEFIKEILEQGRKVRNRNIGVQLFHATSDLLTSLSPFLDSQQRRALDLLQKKIKEDPQYLKGIEKRNLKYSSDHAQGFALTLSRGDEIITDQTRLGNSQILLPGETRREVIYSSESDPNIIQTRIKDLIKPYVADITTLDDEHKKQLIKEVVDIYKDANLITDENLATGKRVANNILNLVEDLVKDPEDKGYYLRNWDKLKIISYLAESTGEAQGGQERFFTLNQELTFKMHQERMNVDKGKGLVSAANVEAAKSLPKNVVASVAKTGVYFAGYLASYGLGVAKGVPRSAFSSAIAAGFWPLGPLWSGAYGAMTEAGSDINTKFYKHESNVTRQLRQVSREKTLRKEGSETDIVRSELEEALVTALPASEMTENINKLILQDQNNWNSETSENLSSDQITELLVHIANAHARLELSLRSGYKDIKYKTQNWVSYSEGKDQEELTNLKAANLQAFFRLKNLQDTSPEIFSTQPLFDANGGDLEKIISCYASIIKTGLQEGLPIGQLETNPLSNFASKKFYKQIFEASSIDESEMSGVENLLTTFKNDKKVIGGKTMYEWMDESESLKSRMKTLNQLKLTRGITAGATTALTSIAIGGAKQAVHQILNNAATPDNTPTPTATETKVQIDLPNIFKEPSNGSVQIYRIFDADSGKTDNVQIPLADGYKFVPDNQNNIDIQNASGQTVYDNVFVFDNTHQALVPNHAFVPDAAHPDVKIDLDQYINFEVKQHLGIQNGEPINLWNKAADYRIVWAPADHFRPDSDNIFATNDPTHPFGVEIRFPDDRVTNPNNGEITTFDQHYSDGSLSALVEIRGIGQILLKSDSFDKVINPDGSHYFSLKLDPTSIEKVTLADGTETTMGQIAQNVLNEQALKNYPVGPINSDLKVETMEIFNLANPNTNQRGFILMGFTTDGDTKGHTPIPGDNEIFMPVHLVTGTSPINQNATIIPTGDATYEETLNFIPPQPIEAAVPAEDLAKTGSTQTTNFSPLPTTYYSPQLNPTVGEQNIPASSTPLPKTVINSSEFKKEQQPREYTNQEALNHLKNRPKNIKDQDYINAYILEKVFTPKQQELIRLKYNSEFQRKLYEELENTHLNIRELISDDNRILTQQEKRDLKNTVLRVAKNQGLSDQEALIINQYLIHRNYLDSLQAALRDQKTLNEELAQLNIQLNSSTRIPPNINPPPTPRPKPQPDPSEPIESQVMKRKLDVFTSEIVDEYHDLIILKPNQEVDPKRFDHLKFSIDNFIRKNFIPDKLKDTYINIIQSVEEDPRFDTVVDKMPNVIAKLGKQQFDIADKKILRKTLQEFLNFEEAEVAYLYFVNLNKIQVQLMEKIEEKKGSPSSPPKRKPTNLENTMMEASSESVIAGDDLIRLFRKEDRDDSEKGVTWVSKTEQQLDKIYFQILPDIMGVDRNQIPIDCNIALEEINAQLINLQYVMDNPEVEKALSVAIKKFNDEMEKFDDDFEPKVTNITQLISENEKEIKKVSIDLETDEIIYPEEENDTPDWLKSMVAEPNDNLNPDDASATDLKFGEDKREKQFSGEELYDQFANSEGREIIDFENMFLPEVFGIEEQDLNNDFNHVHIRTFGPLMQAVIEFTIKRNKGEDLQKYVGQISVCLEEFKQEAKKAGLMIKGVNTEMGLIRAHDDLLKYKKVETRFGRAYIPEDKNKND